LFVVSLVGSASSLLYTLWQFQLIGEGLYAINACYLPLADETTKLDLIVFQLQREQDRLSRQEDGPPVEQFLNAEFYVKELNEGLLRTEQIVIISQNSSLKDDLNSFNRLNESTLAAKNQLDRYREIWRNWSIKENNRSEEINELEKQKIRLVLSIRQLASIVNSQMITISQQTEASRKKAYQLGGTLAFFSSFLWVMLLVLALRTLRPFEQLTTQVQRLKAGERVQPLSGGISSEISVLMNEFNSMADAVEERDRILSQRAKALDILSQRLQQAIDSIQIGLFVVEESKITMLNTSAQEMWNIEINASPPSWMLGHIDSEMKIQSRIYQVTIADFGLSGHIVVTEDITQRINDKEQLHRAQRLALIGKMLAQVTHEIRNPLNAMSLNVEMLIEEDLSTMGNEMLEIISIEIRRLEKTTQRYLDLSRRKETFIEKHNPYLLIQEIIQFEGQKPPVNFQIIGHGTEVNLDEDIFRRSIRNLIRNAIEANATTITFVLSIEESSIIIEINDNGDGMDPGQQDSAFDLFFTTKTTGTGLGLAICRQELESFGASIRLITKANGTCFELTLHR
jgi:nitrogen fixation/metabolism regulation signal transduction histidine kinase